MAPPFSSSPLNYFWSLRRPLAAVPPPPFFFGITAALAAVIPVPPRPPVTFPPAFAGGDIWMVWMLILNEVKMLNNWPGEDVDKLIGD